MDSKIFLLGGADLEMLSIKELLLAQGFIENKSFFDKKLSWGAKLSAYKTQLDTLTGVEIYGIELVEDIETPENYKCIDHHNEKAHLPSSLEQVATLLHIELNEYQKLVAANDSGYIPAMQNLNASEEQIQEIRLKDRAAQGVSKHDERLAEEAIKHKLLVNGLVIIKSATSKFSPITDRLFGQQEELLIYTHNELTYYGYKTDRLKNSFKNLVDANKAYCGGGTNGFFGIASNSFNTEELNKIKNQIVEIINSHEI